MTDRDDKPAGAAGKRPSKSQKPPLPSSAKAPGAFKLKLPSAPAPARPAPAPARAARQEAETLTAVEPLERTSPPSSRDPASQVEPLASLPRTDAGSDKYIGAVIDGRYKVLELLGEGGMGVVYRCRRRVFDTEVAVKILRSDFAKDPEATERFVTEAKAASAIGHQHIVHVIDFGELPDGSVYFAMEYLHGRTLGELIERGELLGSLRIASIGRQIAEGLGAAHRAGIVHRDLKPENVFIIDRGGDFVKILDFGIAKVAGAQNKITRAGAIFGTPHYMAPEQCRGTAVDERTDVYALGVLLYEMAAGRPPFDAESPLGILSQHLNEPPVPPSELGDVPPPPAALEAVILKCLQKEPEDRFQTMSLVARALAGVERSEPAEELAIDVSLDSTLPPPGDASESRDSRPDPELAARPPAHSTPFLLSRRSLTDVPASAVVPEPAISRPRAPPTLTAVVDDAEAVSAFRKSQRRRWPAVLAVLVLASLGASLTLGVWLPSPALLTEAVQAGRPLVLAEPASDHAPHQQPEGRSVALVLSPIDAKVYSGSKLLGTMPLTVEVGPGEKLRLTVKRDGFWPRKIVVDDSKSKILVRLAPIPGKKPVVPPPKTPPAAAAETEAEEGAEEAVDDTEEEATEPRAAPVAKQPAKPGKPPAPKSPPPASEDDEP